jgi:hypothetical protein
MVVALVFGMFGTKRHNKFALTVALCTLLLGVSVTLIISVTLFVAVTPTYSKGFANEYVFIWDVKSFVVQICVEGQRVMGGPGGQHFIRSPHTRTHAHVTMSLHTHRHTHAQYPSPQQPHASSSCGCQSLFPHMWGSVSDA